MRRVLSAVIALLTIIMSLTASLSAFFETPDELVSGELLTASIDEPAFHTAALDDHVNSGHVSWQANSLSGETVTDSTYAGKLQIIILFRADGQCYNSNSTFQTLARESWVSDERVKVIAIGMGNAYDDTDTVRQNVVNFKETNAPGVSSIDFCYATSSEGWSILRSFLGSTTRITFAVNFIVDPELNFRYTWQGAYSEESVKQALELAGIDLSAKPTPDNTVYDIETSGNRNYAEAYRVLDELNRHRAANGLSLLVMDSELLETAMKRAAELSLYYGHTRPDGSDCFEIFPEKFRYYPSAENIAIGFSSAESVMNAWKNSTGHNENMLTAGYNSVGIGCYITNEGVCCWVQNFCYGIGDPASVRSDTVKVTEKISMLPEMIAPRFYMEATGSEMFPGDTVKIYAKNVNIRYNVCVTGIKLNYFNSDNPQAVSVAPDGTGSAVVTAVSAGKAKITVGFESRDGFLITASREFTVRSFIPGDTNGDKQVTLDDAILALKRAMGVEAGSKFITEAADINGDSRITLEDAVAILKIVMDVK